MLTERKCSEGPDGSKDAVGTEVVENCEGRPTGFAESVRVSMSSERRNYLVDGEDLQHPRGPQGYGGSLRVRSSGECGDTGNRIKGSGGVWWWRRGGTKGS